MSDKGFKTIDEQLEILRTRGLTIHDDQKAKEFLLYNNYYRISGYSLTLRKNDMLQSRPLFKISWISTILTMNYGISS